MVFKGKRESKKEEPRSNITFYYDAEEDYGDLINSAVRGYFVRPQAKAAIEETFKPDVKQGNMQAAAQEVSGGRIKSNEYPDGLKSLDGFVWVEPAKSDESKKGIDAEIVSDKELHAFEETHGKYTLDKYQKQAIDDSIRGKSVIVDAPTGTGKTLIAEHVMKDALDRGKKVIYLSPLKALSNEKYTDFAMLFGDYDKDGNYKGSSKVGLLTGDNTPINPNAQLRVMTTEIYRNSLMNNYHGQYDDVDCVIYDEFHYLGDPSRGTVWEESVMNTPPHIKQLMLSATASNSGQIASWIGENNNKIGVSLVKVPESERHVPLRELITVEDDMRAIDFETIKNQKIDIYQLANKINLSERQEKAFKNLKEIKGFSTDDEAIGFLNSIKEAKTKLVDSKILSSELQKAGADKDKADSISLILSNKNSTIYKKQLEGNLPRGGAGLSTVIKKMNQKGMLPALTFIFSKKGCNSSFDYMVENMPSLLTEEESQAVLDEITKALEKNIYFGMDFDEQHLKGLMKGYAVHHAGRLPAYKSLVEKLARKGLVKVCFATETLLAGIDLPIKTTVFTSFEKFDGENVVDISPSTFKQGGGRAGRRGKDEIGNIIVMDDSQGSYDKMVALSRSKDTSIKSRYSPTYASRLSDVMLNDVEGTLLKSLAATQNPNKLDYLEKLMENKLEVLKTYGYVEENEDGALRRTEKGEIAKSVYGINEILMTELLTNPEYLKGCTDVELTLIASMFFDTKDENPTRILTGDYSYFNNRLLPICDLVDSVEMLENYNYVEDEPINFSCSIAPFVADFEQSGSSREEALECWKNLMSTMIDKDLLSHEGDFLRIVNGTIDILSLISELSPDEEVKTNAQIAISKLRKSPVTDIAHYELGRSD